MLEKNTYHCNLIKSFRRTLSISIEPDGGITIRAPLGMSQRRIDKFLEEKKSWIKKKVAAAKNQKQKADDFIRKIDPNLIKKYKKHAREVLNERANYYAEKYDLPFNCVRLSSAKARWGSCGPTNNLNFSWRIIFAPPSVLDYLVVHELAHTKHKDHQKGFWNLVEIMDPEYKTNRKWLKDNGYLLQAKI